MTNPVQKSRQFDLACIGKLIGEQLCQFRNVPIKKIQQPTLAFTDLRWKSWAGLQMAQALTNIRNEIYEMLTKQMGTVNDKRVHFERQLLQIETVRVSFKAQFDTM